MSKNNQLVKTSQVLSNEQIELVKTTVAKGATDDELKLFLYTSARTGLDPLTRQIYFVKRAGQMTIQTGIDGYRAIAERSGTLAGIDDAVYDSEDKPHPNKATVTVYRLINGERVSYTASARWSEYAVQGGFMWNKMPYLMLAKCAESLALRKAFPNDLSGLYTSEEMQQAEMITAEIKDLPKPIQPTKAKAYGAQKVEKPDPLKAKIKELIDELDPTLEMSANQKELYPKFVKEKTGFDLADPTKYEMIIKSLERLVENKNKVTDAQVEELAEKFEGEVVK